jgi:hypothetical protein
MDQRVEQLEQNMSSLMSSNQQLMEKMSEIYAKLSTILINRKEGEGSHSRSERRTEGRGHTDGGLNNNNHQYTPRTVKLDFPRFNGAEDPTSWICRAEQFFRFHETPIEDHVALASFHLEGEAQLWYQLLQQEAESLNWPTFKAGLLARYGPTQFFDHFGELTKLQQIGTMKDYHTKFEQLLAKAGPLPRVRQVSCFVSKEGIKADVLAGRPADLSTAIGLARLYEARNSSFRRTTAPVLPINKMPPFSPREDTKPRSSFPLKRLTPTELKERREKGLCYNCNERFVPGHRCKKLFVIEACSEEEDNDSDMELEELEEIETPGISLHAMRGRDGFETMRVAGLIQAVPTTILLDSGSSHNFVSESLARKLQLHPVKGPRIRVMVASGEKLASKGKCVGVAVKLGKFQLQVDFFILPLEGYEVVLGTQWLRTLGEILWDFSKLTMKFQWNGRLVMLKVLTDQVIEGYELEKEVGVHPVGALLQLLAIESQNYTAAKGVAAPELQKILETFRDIFKEPMGLPPNCAHDHCIPLQPGSQPVCSKPYRHPHYQKSEIERLVTELLSTGVIRPSNSPFSSPVILVKKHDGTWRMCVDYRALNRITIKDKFPIPIIDELLNELHGAKFFSKLDLRFEYHQIRVQASDIPKTTFRTHHGHFEFLVMPFGLTNAPSTFQSLMNEIFKNQLRRYVLVFFDDILVYSTNWEDHLKHLETTLAILKNHNLFAKLGKCEFGQMSVRYLGHIISHEGVGVDPEKISTMVEWPQPCSTRAMRGFLGLTGYYRKFIQDYGKIAAPLTQMLRKNSFNWSEKAVASFEKLKASMTQAPVLALPDFSRQFVVECDASGSGIGAVLRQDLPIAFHSQALHGKNLLMSTYEKEMLALVMAVLKWKHYLLGRKFVVRTDQRSLQYLWSQKIATEAQQMWLYKLMGFDFSIEYK